MEILQLRFAALLMTSPEAYPLTPPPEKRSFPPKCVTKPELRDEGAEDVIPALKIALAIGTSG